MVSLLLSLSSGFESLLYHQLLELPQLLVHLGLDVGSEDGDLACRGGEERGAGQGEAMGLRDCP